VAVHCYGGIGRSPLVAAAVLVRSGRSAQAAWQLVGRARGLRVPDTDDQRDWLSSFK
jgi:protein-tyrosine phosphatase